MNKQESKAFKRAWNAAFNDVYMNVLHQRLGIAIAVTLIVYFKIIE